MRAASVTAIVLMNLVRLAHDRSNERRWLARMRSPNPVLWSLSALTLLAWGAVLVIEPLRALFRLEVAWPDLALQVLSCGARGDRARSELPVVAVGGVVDEAAREADLEGLCLAVVAAAQAAVMRRRRRSR